MSSTARVRVAAALIAAGLATEGITLHWSHPLAFIVFALAGGLCIGAGAILFLTTLLGATLR